MTTSELIARAMETVDGVIADARQKLIDGLAADGYTDDEIGQVLKISDDEHEAGRFKMHMLVSLIATGAADELMERLH